MAYDLGGHGEDAYSLGVDGGNIESPYDIGDHGYVEGYDPYGEVRTLLSLYP